MAVVMVVHDGDGRGAGAGVQSLRLPFWCKLPWLRGLECKSRSLRVSFSVPRLVCGGIM